MAILEHFSGISETAKYTGDAFSFGTLAATLAAWLPAAAALLTIIWTAIRIYETTTFQKLLAKWRAWRVGRDG